MGQAFSYVKMLKDIYRTAKKTTTAILYGLTPFGFYGFVVSYFELEPLTALGLIIPVMVIEIVLVVKYVIPNLGNAFTQTVLAGNVGAEEKVFEKAQEIFRRGDAQGALKVYTDFRENNTNLIRAWIMESNMLLDLQRPHDAVMLLEQGANCRRWRKEDRALFLYKMANIYMNRLNNQGKAIEIWEEAVDKYPRTAYGRASADKLRGVRY